MAPDLQSWSLIENAETASAAEFEIILASDTYAIGRPRDDERKIELVSPFESNRADWLDELGGILSLSQGDAEHVKEAGAHAYGCGSKLPCSPVWRLIQ